MVDIKETLRLHALWLADQEGGVRADLSGADLSGANLYEANLWSVRGNGSYIKSLQIGKYDVAYTTEVLQIGCQRKPITEWFSMDSIPGHKDDDAEWLAFRPLIKQIIEQCPATPAGKENRNG